MHKRVELKKAIEPELQNMDVEESGKSEETDDEDVSNQNNIANIVIKLFNKKVGSLESEYEECL